MDKSQIGRAGELAIELYALVTSGGEVDIYTPVVDDDHVDLVAGIRGGPPTLGIQVKTTPGLDRSGLVEATASYGRTALRHGADSRPGSGLNWHLKDLVGRVTGSFMDPLDGFGIRRLGQAEDLAGFRVGPSVLEVHSF
jgi:hypothetical protein